MNYLVVECHPGYAVVLSGDGRFLKVANIRYEIGQTVTSVVEARLPDVQKQTVKGASRRWVGTMAAMAACLILVFTGLFMNSMPYASVYMRINPEVRIDVNRRDMVVGVESVNADGAALLTDYEYRKKDLDLVMAELTDRAIDMGYLHAGGTITVTLEADEAWSIDHSGTISTSLKEHLGEKMAVTIEVTGQYVPQPPQNTSPGDFFEIPVEPETVPTEKPKPAAAQSAGGASSGGDSGYGDSGYGDSGYGDSGYDD